MTDYVEKNVLANTLKLSNAACKLALERAELAETMLKFERQEGITDNKLRIRAEALADKRLVLLKRLIMDLSWCPICGTTLIQEVTYERFSHTDDCELAEAIAEE